MFDYDVIFIGSGHACWHGAITLVSAGKKVAIIDRGAIGGTCTNYGCDAKILLDGPFEYVSGLKNYKDICIDSAPAIGWSGLMKYKKAQIGVLPVGLEAMLTSMGIVIKKGHATLKDEHTVTVNKESISGEYIVIGTGMRSAQMNIAGREHLHNSKDFLDLDDMPDRIVFAGAGVISMEFASMALTLGKNVTLIECSNKALVSYPEQYVDRLTDKMKSEGAKFHFAEFISEIEKKNGEYIVHTQSGLAVACDYVMDTTGRVANVEDLGLEELGIESSHHGIGVDEHLRTAVKNIYASGDVVYKEIPRLTPTAAFESEYIAAHILGKEQKPIQYPAVPSVVFTLPRIAQVGVKVKEAETIPEKYRIARVPYSQTMLWLAKNEKDIDITFIFDKSNCLVGAAVYGSEAGTWIDVLTLIINQKLTADQLKNIIFSFPTSTYGLISFLISQSAMSQ